MKLKKYMHIVLSYMYNDVQILNLVQFNSTYKTILSNNFEISKVFPPKKKTII